MSIAEDKARIEGAKADLATWLTDNGVTVPDGALLDELVALLGDVEVGGGVKIATGTKTMAEDSSNMANVLIEHSLGVRPDFILIYRETNVVLKNEVPFAIKVSKNLSTQNDGYGHFVGTNRNGSSSGYSYGMQSTYIQGNITSSDYIGLENATSFVLKTAYAAGSRYRWLVLSGGEL